jgi:hypothetical protein
MSLRELELELTLKEFEITRLIRELAALKEQKGERLEEEWLEMFRMGTEMRRALKGLCDGSFECTCTMCSAAWAWDWKYGGGVNNLTADELEDWDNPGQSEQHTPYALGLLDVIR